MKKQGIGSLLVRFSTRSLGTIMKLIVVLLGREILMRKRAEEKTQAMAKREAQYRMNEFLSIASHELKTPLTSIKGNIQLMGRRLKSQTDEQNTEQSKGTDETTRLLADARDLLERTDQQVTRLTRIVNGLLESSRISGNTMDLLFEVTDLHPLLREVTEAGRYVPEKRTLQLEPGEELNLLVMADATRIKQVVIHLLSNAHKYSPLEKPIVVTIQKEQKAVRVSIRDEGPGISSQEQKNIWERFYRSPDAQILNGSEVGLGLGLHISRTIIEQHRGRIGLESDSGKGSTFWFALPLADEQYFS